MKGHWKGSSVPVAEPAFHEGRNQREGVGGGSGKKTQGPKALRVKAEFPNRCTKPL